VLFKKNLADIIERNRRLWSREGTDLVLAKIDLDEGGTMRMWERALAPGTCPDYRKMFEVFLEDFQRRECLQDDAMPTARPNFGDYGFGAYVGAEVTFGQGGACAKPLLSDLADTSRLCFDPDNEWIRLLEESTRYFAEQAQGKCATSIIETTDSLNFAENVFGSSVFMELYDHPRELLDLFDFACDLNIRLIELQRKHIARVEGGYFDLHEEWLPGDCVWLSIDAWGSCSLQDFRSLGRGHLQKIVDHFGSGWLHMHNSHLHLLEEVVTVRDLAGIGIMDDPKQVPSFDRLASIQEVTGDIPLQINCRKEPFLAALEDGTLPRNVMYWIDSGVGSVEEANAIMDRVRDF
jgi:hypothetical protein